MGKILGFDVSSTCIGWGLLSNDNKIIKYLNSGYIKPPKDDNIIKRLAMTRDLINNLIDQLNPNYIGVENIVKFMGGKSSSDTIIMLTSFNRMVCLTAYDKLGKLPELFNVNTMRSKLKIDKGRLDKTEIPGLIEQHLNITFPYVKNGKDKIQKESYDIADGLLVALYYANMLKC